MTALRELLRSAEFRSRLSSPEAPETKEVEALMNEIEESDLGIESACRAASRFDVAYVPIVENCDFHVCLFLLGPRATIPLHDHPEMTVFSRVMRGAVSVNSYDFVSGDKRVSRQHPLRVIEAPATTAALYPRIRNVHEFVAGENGVVILDVIVPPYDDENRRRPCTYYHVEQQEKDDLVRLAVTIPEPDFSCHTVRYSGVSP